MNRDSIRFRTHSLTTFALRRYSNSTKLQNQFSNLHPSTLSCVPSIAFKVVRRQEGQSRVPVRSFLQTFTKTVLVYRPFTERFVAKQVDSTSQKLRALESVVASARGGEKEAASEALESYVAEKRENVTARFSVRPIRIRAVYEQLNDSFTGSGCVELLEGQVHS